MPVPYHLCDAEPTEIKLRITADEDSARVMLRLEGRIAGAWSDEFARTWQQMGSSLGERKLLVDLSGVMQMDRKAKAVLADMYKATGAEFIAKTPLTQYFADEARRGSNKNEEEK